MDSWMRKILLYIDEDSIDEDFVQALRSLQM
jgi:hypothetical protein